MGFKSKSEFQNISKAGPSAEFDQMIVVTETSMNLSENISHTAAKRRMWGVYYAVPSVSVFGKTHNKMLPGKKGKQLRRSLCDRTL